MMKLIDWKNCDDSRRKQALARPAHKDDAQAAASARDIVQQVKAKGDEAVRAFSRRFDRSSRDDCRVSPEEIAAAVAQMKPDLRAALEQAMANVTAFHQAQKPQGVEVETMPGVACALHWRPIDTVGLYIPGGSAPLYSTLYMQAIPARIADCRRIILCAPPQAGGQIHPDILATASLCGIGEVFAVGGAQAIAAMAYGTATVPKVDKICGPGNIYVTLAKQIVAADPDGAAIDQPAGPSEVMVIAEDSANAAWVAADLLAQAEHDADAQALLVTISPSFAERVQAEVARQLETLPRQAIAAASLQQGRIILAPDMETAITISNLYAPEHLILHSPDAAAYLPDIRHAGSVFLGPWTPESAGDYASGTNNVLPTYGYARTYGGISVYTFLKTMTVQNMTQAGLNKLGPTIVKLAEGEGLEAHAAAVRIRIGAKS